MSYHVGADRHGRSLTLERALHRYVETFRCELGFYVQHLETNEAFGYNADRQFRTASVFKIAVLLEVFRQEDAGRFDLNDTVPVTSEAVRPGSGVLQYLNSVVALSIRDLAVLMIVISDNTATEVLLRKVGMEGVNATLRELGLTQTRVTPPWRECVSTPQETARLLELIYRDRAAGPAACAAMADILTRQQLNDRIPLLLPSLQVAHKTGDLPGIVNDAGIVYSSSGSYLFVCFTGGVAGEALVRWKMARLSRAVFDYFSLPAVGTGRGERAAGACLSQGWSLLSDQQWEDAVERFWWSLRCPGGAVTRTLTLLGIGAALSHTDVQWWRRTAPARLLERFTTQRVRR